MGGRDGTSELRAGIRRASANPDPRISPFRIVVFDNPSIRSTPGPEIPLVMRFPGSHSPGFVRGHDLHARLPASSRIVPGW